MLIDMELPDSMVCARCGVALNGRRELAGRYNGAFSVWHTNCKGRCHAEHPFLALTRCQRPWGHRGRHRDDCDAGTLITWVDEKAPTYEAYVEPADVNPTDFSFHPGESGDATGALPKVPLMHPGDSI